MQIIATMSYIVVINLAERHAICVFLAIPPKEEVQILDAQYCKNKIHLLISKFTEMIQFT